MRSLVVFLAASLCAGCSVVRDPSGANFQLPTQGELTTAERASAARIKADIAGAFSDERNITWKPEHLRRAADHILKELREHYSDRGDFDPAAGAMDGIRRQWIDIPAEVYGRGPHRVPNIELTLAGSSPGHEIIVVGAHYDSAFDTPGANDNGTGTAVALEVARRLRGKPLARTVRIVLFANEEEPYFVPGHPAHKYMGSRVYAEAAKARGDDIALMISLETLGYYTSHPESQCLAPRPLDHKHSLRPGDDHGPRLRRKEGGEFESNPPLVECAVSGSLLGPEFSKGDFLAVVSTYGQKEPVRVVTQALHSLQASSPKRRMRVEGIAMLGLMPGVDWSDHRSFIGQGFAAVMLTDTAPARYPFYHYREDKAEWLHFPMLGRAALRIAELVACLSTHGVRSDAKCTPDAGND